MPKEELKQLNNDDFSEEDTEKNIQKEEPQRIKLSWLKEGEKKEEGEKAEPISERFSLLEEKRNNYIQAYQQHLRETPRWRRIFTREKKEEELPEELKRLKSKYDEAKYAYCKDLVGSKKADLEREGKSGEALEKELAAYKFTAIYSKIFLEEKELLQKAKVETWPPKEKGIFRKGLDLWMRQGKHTRLLITTSLLTGVSIATGGLAAGGFGAATLFAGSRYAKGLTSAFIAQGVGKGVDWVISKAFIEKVKKEIEETKEQLKEGLAIGELTLDGIKAIEVKHQQLTEKLAEMERGKVLIKAIAMIGTGFGVSIGLNWLENAYAGGETGQPSETPPSKPGPVGQGDYEPKTDYDSFKSFQEGKLGAKIEDAQIFDIDEESIAEAGTIETISAVETASEKLNSVWKMAEHQLDQRGFFKGLTGSAEEIAAKKTFLIDAIKDKITENPSVFGLEDVDKLTPDQKIDFSNIFTDENLLKEALLAKAGKLSTQDIANILNNNKNIVEFHNLHRNIPITSENVDIIAAGRGDELLRAAEIASRPETQSIILETPPALEFKGDSLIQNFGDKNLAQQESIIGNFDQRAQALQNQFSLTDEFSPERYRIQGQLEHLASLKEQAVNVPSFIESHENFISYLYSLKKEIGLKFDEYGAIKNVKVGKFLEEISKYEKGEILDETGMRVYPNLPHSGIYGGIELQHQIKLAETLKGILKVKAPEGGLDMTVDGLIKNHIGGVFR